MRRNVLDLAIGAGFLGMISAVALIAATSASFAASAEEDLPSAVEAQAPALPAEVDPVTAAAPVEVPSAVAEPTKADLPTARPGTEATAPHGYRVGGDSTGKATTTRYSHKQGANLSTAGATTAAKAPAASLTDVTCHAGCNAKAGETVFSPTPANTAASAIATVGAEDDYGRLIAKAEPAKVVTCVAGCYGGNTSYDVAVPVAVESGMVATRAKLPRTPAAASGEWLVRINRERGVEPKK